MRLGHSSRDSAPGRWVRRFAVCLLPLVTPALLHVTGMAEGPVTIHLAGEAWFLNTLTKTGLIREFESKTGIQVEVAHMDHRALAQELERERVPTSPPYDVILMRHRFLGKLVEEGLVQPIEPFLADPAMHDPAFKPQEQLFADWWREISGYKGKVYGYPYAQLTTYLCYRKDLLNSSTEKVRFKARYGRVLDVPKNWDEYVQLAEFFTRPQEGLFGTYIQGREHIALWYEWLNLSYAFGGNLLESNHGCEYGDIVINSPQNVAATNQYLALIAYSPPDTLSYNWNGALAALQQGRAFMGLLWNDQAPLLEDTSQSKVAGKIGYSLIPSAVGKPFSQLEGWTYLIPKESRHPREAYRFMEWALSPEVQIAETFQGGTSPTKATYEDARVRSLPFVSSFLASIPLAIPKPTVPESGQITEVMQKGLSEIVTRKRSPREGLDILALEVQRILGGKARLRYPVQRTAAK